MVLCFWPLAAELPYSGDVVGLESQGFGLEIEQVYIALFEPKLEAIGADLVGVPVHGGWD